MWSRWRRCPRLDASAFAGRSIGQPAAPHGVHRTCRHASRRSSAFGRHGGASSSIGSVSASAGAARGGHRRLGTPHPMPARCWWPPRAAVVRSGVVPASGLVSLATRESPSGFTLTASGHVSGRLVQQTGAWSCERTRRGEPAHMGLVRFHTHNPRPFPRPLWPNRQSCEGRCCQKGNKPVGPTYRGGAMAQPVPGTSTR